jgi:hypothetical protein
VEAELDTKETDACRTYQLEDAAECLVIGHSTSEERVRWAPTSDQQRILIKTLDKAEGIGEQEKKTSGAVSGAFAPPESQGYESNPPLNFK